MEKLTKRQQEILQFLKDWIEQYGYPPTRAEMAQALGFRSPNAAEDHLKTLARKGAIEMTAGVSRGFRILEEPASYGIENGLATIKDGELPIVGRVSAGTPILAQENVDSTCPISADFFRPRADFLLQVRGQSMQDVGIMDGDLLAVHRTPVASNGQIVVARIDNEVTVKRYKREGNLVWLLAENPDYQPIKVDLREQELVIEGLSVGVIRR